MLRQRHRTPSPLVANCCLLHQLRDSVASWPSLLHQAVSNPLDRHAAKTRSWFGPFFFAANTSPLPKKIPTPVQRRSLPPLSKQDPSLRKQTPLFLRRLPSEEDHPLLLFALRGGGDWATGFVKDPPLEDPPHPYPIDAVCHPLSIPTFKPFNPCFAFHIYIFPVFGSLSIRCDMFVCLIIPRQSGFCLVAVASTYTFFILFCSLPGALLCHHPSARC